MITNNFVDLFLKNMFTLDDAYGFASHNTTIKFSALISTLKNVTLSQSTIDKNLHSIKTSFDIDSPFQKEHALILATLLNINSNLSLENVNTTFNQLESTFSTNNFLALSSEILNFYCDNSKISNSIPKIKSTYDLFKKRHWFITGPEDISICTLFSITFDDTLPKITETEKCYNYLEKVKYFPSSYVQSLSQALVFSNSDIDTRCLSAIKLQGLFERQNYIIRNEALPILGFASISTDNFDEFINHFIAIHTTLNNNTRFKTYKLKEEINYIISLSLTILDFTNNASILDPLIVFLLNICTHETNSFTENIINKLFLD
ncbi:MAG: DUF4003 family protein [Clostridium sp.]|uniref:DUF4003 family protein n=1 Tax=Clostridium sp. TaxID=1506 RepID=UPI003F4153FC